MRTEDQIDFSAIIREAHRQRSLAIGDMIAAGWERVRHAVNGMIGRSRAAAPRAAYAAAQHRG
jgi:hypothetical protein